MSSVCIAELAFGPHSNGIFTLINCAAGENKSTFGCQSGNLNL